MEFVRSLSEAPHTQGDYVDMDDAYRKRQIKIVGKYAITYWADHATKVVMVVCITQAGARSSDYAFISSITLP